MIESELLNVIENKFSWKKNDFGRYILIFEEISNNINSTSGSDRLMWCKVMDLYKTKHNA